MPSTTVRSSPVLGGEIYLSTQKKKLTVVDFFFFRENPIFQKSLNLEKRDLDSIVTIGQVEDKFIAALLNGTYLCLFDQHALHERIRLERLLSEHFTSTREVLKGEPNQPVPLYIGTHEVNRLLAMV